MLVKHYLKRVDRLCRMTMLIGMASVATMELHSTTFPVSGIRRSRGVCAYGFVASNPFTALDFTNEEKQDGS